MSWFVNKYCNKLPPSFSNEIVKSASAPIIRTNIQNLEDVNKWMKEFGVLTNTRWITRKSTPCGQRMKCSKQYFCQHSSYKKVPAEINKRSFSKNSSCPAKINIKVKNDTCGTRKLDSYIQKGLLGVITIIGEHNHALDTAEALKFLPAADSKEKFLEYFQDGMNAVESQKYHERALELDENISERDLANSRINPPIRAVQYWYSKVHLPRIGKRGDQKMEEKDELYNEKGVANSF